MSTKFTCRFCKEQFDVPKGLYKHLQQAHNAGVSRDNRTCPICGVLCSKYEGYRDHLLYIHGQTDDGQKLTFKSLNEFLVWKAELELKHNCKYVLQTSPKVLPTKEKKYFYQCDRSDSKSKDKKSVVMKTCSSVISVVEGPGVFKIEYWDTHSGHSEAPTVQPPQNELDTAISSVEMVNAIADSDDSFDRSEDFSMTDCTSPISNADKQKLFSNVNTPANSNSINNSPTSKTKTFHSSLKFEGSKKKNTNTSVLYSLASVACGKGISKKTAKKPDESAKKPDENIKTPDENMKKTDENMNKTDENMKKTDENKNVEQPEMELITKNSNETPNQTILSTSEEQNVDSAVTVVSESVALPLESSSSAITTTSAPLSVTTKTTSAPLATIAPKITTLNTNNINSLFTANSAFPNQLVIVNPVGMDQNSLSSNQNVFSAGQNIVFSLGSLGQNIIPVNTVSQSSNPVSAKAEKNVMPSTSKMNSVKITASNVITTAAKTAVNVSLNASNSIVTATSTIPSTTPITLAAGLNNAPVILSSLPVGSTFMSVNNNLIPIATPSGTFLPTNLPPNVVLTPVMAGTTASSTSGSVKSTVSGVTTLAEPAANVQTAVRYSTSSTVAITVSSIVKEPVYTSSTIKHFNNIAPSKSTPVSSTASVKTYARGKIQSKPISTLTSIQSSPVKSDGKFMTSTPIKSIRNLKPNRKYNSSIVNEEEAAKIIAALTNKLGHNISVSKVNSTVPSTSLSAADVVTVSTVPVTSPKAGTSARKRITRNNKTKSVASPLNIKPKSSISSIVSSVNSKSVTSPLNIAPKPVASNLIVSSQHTNAQKSGTLVFESSGEIYMLEPLENEHVGGGSSLRNVSSTAAASKIKIDRSVQTAESPCTMGLKSKLQRKRAAPPTDDSAVMLKVKCYQLEMKYLNIQTECKRLKVELTKERLKNAELTGQKVPVNLDEEVSSADSRNKAAEIMKEIEDKFSENKDVHIYTMTKTSVLRSLYEDLEELCLENSELHKELETYREHDKFYKSLKKKLYEEEF